jgi:hypothetical protein
MKNSQLMDYMLSLHFMDFISWGVLDTGPLYCITLWLFKTRWGSQWGSRDWWGPVGPGGARWGPVGPGGARWGPVGLGGSSSLKEGPFEFAREIQKYNTERLLQ